MRILITGAAGFIGSKVMYGLARRGDEVVGIDNINDYYDVRLKYGRLRQCGFVAAAPAAAAVSSSEVPHFGFGEVHVSSDLPNCRFIRMDIADKENIDRLFEKEKFDKVVNLAAQAVEELERLYRRVQIPDMVCLMKRIVPEYKSENTTYAEYDDAASAEESISLKV